MSFSISPISSYTKVNNNISFKGARYACDVQTLCPPKNENAPELVAKGGFKDGKLQIATMYKNCIDSNIWYTIDEDGRGFIQTAWCPGKDVKEGTYSEIYREAKELSDKNNGRLSDEDAIKIAEKIKQVDFLV